MSEEVKVEQEDEVLKAVREEYEKKLEEQRKAFEEEKKQALAEAEEKHIKQIRALLSGEGHIPREDKTEEIEETKSVEETILDSLRNKKIL